MQGEKEHVTPIDISVQAEFLNDTKYRLSDHVQNHTECNDDTCMYIECPSTSIK